MCFCLSCDLTKDWSHKDWAHQDLPHRSNAKTAVFVDSDNIQVKSLV